MKVDGVINTTGTGDLFGLTEQRKDEIQKLIDGIFADIQSKKIKNKSEVVKMVIEFSTTTVEAVVIYGWFESRITARELASEADPIRKIMTILSK